MINKLHIKNFLAFPELVVPELKLINLVAGKNNAGKTALLDALRVYRSLDKEETSRQIAQERGRDDKYFSHALMYSKEGVMSPLAEVNDLSIVSASSLRSAQFKVNEKPVADFLMPYHEALIPFVYVAANVNDHAWIAKNWESFVLTEKEELVISILRETIDDNIARIAITDQKILVKKATSDTPVSISHFGQGLTRVLQIAIALVQARPVSSSDTNLLLIDEIETHLHHSVIRKLWKVIFEYAIKWNIQVVATTHSQDAIREFWHEAAEKEDYQKVSQVLRLQIGREGKHEVIQFPFERLDSVMEMEMEIR